MFFNDLENFRNLKPNKKKEIEEELGHIFNYIRDAQALSESIGDIMQGGSIDYIREQLKSNNSKLKIFNKAMWAVNRLKELDPSFLVGADLSKFQIPVLDVAVAHIEAENNRSLDESYLKVEGKRFFSNDDEKASIRHAYQNPRNVADWCGIIRRMDRNQ